MGKLLFEKTSKDRRGVEPVAPDVPRSKASSRLKGLMREDIAGFPELGEVDVVRHYTLLSRRNFGVDSNFYPLGSCTMKHNPKINEDLCRLPGFAALHPYSPEDLSQGALELMSRLEGYLCEVTGMDAVTLQPAAGAHGEFAGMLLIKKYFEDKKEKRTKVLIPDTAHGTNPASANLAGFKVVKISSEGSPVITTESIKKAMDKETAALMLTNPNTLGLFEEHIMEIAEVVHSMGGFVYCDGANLNALMGLAKLGAMGVDLVQLNLHKTFSTPHGGGGPGSGPLAVKKKLEPYLPVPRIIETKGKYSLKFDSKKTIGRMKAFYGNFAMMVRAYSYIRRMGPEGLKRASETAILSANYIKEKLKGDFHLPFDRPCMHECVFTHKRQAEKGVVTLDVAKALIDKGIHPPTVYFPLVVDGAIMIEPTETENIETIDCFIRAMQDIAKRAETDPESLKNAPKTTGTERVDETKAAREPVLRWSKKA
ncbi:MAG: aminomethyl-transferring glycine dehydrogenase subunit GcvPB [Deltaproteobacteria bacterium]|nr:aminomethyl-transferring glycine dehydrogenase subunit GcvPB [Deltaproteobacteria bacterium]